MTKTLGCKASPAMLTSKGPELKGRRMALRLERHILSALDMALACPCWRQL